MMLMSIPISDIVRAQNHRFGCCHIFLLVMLLSWQVSTTDAKGLGGVNTADSVGGGGGTTINFYRGGRSYQRSTIDDIFLVLEIAFFAALVVLFCWAKWKSNRQKHSFEIARSEAENDVLTDCQKYNDCNELERGDSGGGGGFFRFSWLKFEASYTDNAYRANNGRCSLHGSSGILNFQVETASFSSMSSFHPHHQYLAISGHGHDTDGPFTIVEGKISPWTGRCYWVEETLTRRSKSAPERVLVAGWFQKRQDNNLQSGGLSSSVVEANNMFFKGMWRAENGADGSFTRFHISDFRVEGSPAAAAAAAATTTAASLPMAEATAVAVMDVLTTEDETNGSPPSSSSLLTSPTALPAHESGILARKLAACNSPK